MTHNDIVKARQISARLKPSRAWKRMVNTREPHPDGAEIWCNNLYTVTVRRYSSGWPLNHGPWAQLGIYCEDGEPRHDWRDMQRIKNDCVGAEWEAVELYPAESRLIDPSNYYILYAAPALPFGLRQGRSVVTPERCLAPQRGWHTGDEPLDADLTKHPGV
jgi:hypothetical protein